MYITSKQNDSVYMGDNEDEHTDTIEDDGGGAGKCNSLSPPLMTHENHLKAIVECIEACLGTLP